MKSEFGTGLWKPRKENCLLQFEFPPISKNIERDQYGRWNPYPIALQPVRFVILIPVPTCIKYSSRWLKQVSNSRPSKINQNLLHCIICFQQFCSEKIEAAYKTSGEFTAKSLGILSYLWNSSLFQRWMQRRDGKHLEFLEHWILCQLIQLTQ